MRELRHKTKLRGLRSARQIQLMLFAVLAIQVSRKVRAYKGFFKAQYRFLAVCVAGMAVVRRFVCCSVNWLRRKDMSATNQRDQVVLVYSINTLLKLSILLLELSIAAFDRRHFILQRIERLSQLECLLKQFALDLQELVFIAHANEAFCNG